MHDFDSENDPYIKQIDVIEKKVAAELDVLRAEETKIAMRKRDLSKVILGDLNAIKYDTNEMSDDQIDYIADCITDLVSQVDMSWDAWSWEPGEPIKMWKASTC